MLKVHLNFLKGSREISPSGTITFLHFHYMYVHFCETTIAIVTRRNVMAATISSNYKSSKGFFVALTIFNKKSEEKSI